MKPSEDTYTRIFGALSVVASGALISAVIGLIFHPLMARMLGSAGYGKLAVYLSGISITSHLLLFGCREGIRRYIPRNNTEDDVVASFGVGILFLLALVPLTTSLLFFKNVIPGVGSSTAFLVALSLVALGFTNIFKGLRSVLYGSFREGVAEVLRIFQRIFYLLISSALVYLGFRVQGVLFGMIASLAAGSLLAYFMVSKELDITLDNFKDSDSRFRKSFLGFSGLMLLTALFNQIHLGIDVVFLGLMKGGESAGVYKAAAVVANFLFTIPAVTQNVSLHNFSEISADEDRDVRKYLSKLLKHVSLLTSLLSVGLFVLAEEVIYFYFGPSYTGAVLPLRILVAGAFFAGLSKTISPVLEADDKVKASVKASGAGMIINVVLNIFLIGLIGIEGAAIASTCSYISMFLIYFFVFQRTYGNIEIGFFGLKLASGGVFTALLMFFLKFYIGKALSILLLPPIGFVAFLTWIYSLGCLEEEDLDLIRGIFRY
ncbi:MAG: flippase [Candidatus Nanosalina sp.]